MTDETRQREVRVNSDDLNALKTAKAEFDTDVPLGYVARIGARKIISESQDSEEVILQ
jgi:hypothetical protein